jgi:hypothetical protein
MVSEWWMAQTFRSGFGVVKAGFVLVVLGCGGRAQFTPPPVQLSVSLSNTTVVVPAGGAAVNIPVVIVAPTETASFTITGLPAGVMENYKESESNPSGLLTLVANSATKPGTYMPTITVGSSNQTASLAFTLVITSAAKTADGRHTVGSRGLLPLATAG